MTMSNLRDCFSFMAIVKVLAMLRAKEAVFRHRNELIRRFFDLKQGESHVHEWSQELKCLLPPRRQWSRPRFEQRGGNGTPKDKILRDSIYRRVHGIFAKGEIDSVEWGRRLRSFVCEINRRIGSDDIAFNEPKLWIRRKSHSDRGRCLSSYEVLSDYVVLAITNKYLSSLIDPTFSKDSYAFRTSVKQTYNKAVSQLVRFRRSIPAKALYVVNCDVQKLFDVIDHSTVLKMLQKRVCELNIDPYVLVVVKAYLNSYSAELVRKKAKEICASKEIEIDLPDWKQVEILHGHGQVNTSQFGIPQGGALSGLLANIVLDEVDKGISQLNDKDLFYARYCDDIIIAHQNLDKCHMALNICLEKLRELKLPVHEVVQAPRYGAEFYRLKSKGPYEWNDHCQYPTIPWVPFLGYNIRFDGNVRIRKETINSHIDSVKAEFMDFLSFLCGARLKDGMTKEKAVADFLCKVIRKSIGRMYAGSAREMGHCWLAAFRNVWRSPCALHQLRHVDEKLMSLVSMVLGGLGLKFSFRHIGRLLSHVAAAKALNKREKEGDISFRLNQLEEVGPFECDKGSPVDYANDLMNSREHLIDEELARRLRMGRYCSTQPTDEYMPSEYDDYWPSDGYEVDWKERNIVVRS